MTGSRKLSTTGLAALLGLFGTLPLAAQTVAVVPTVETAAVPTGRRR